MDLQAEYFVEHNDLLSVVVCESWFDFSTFGEELDGLVRAANWNTNAFVRVRKIDEQNVTSGVLQRIKSWANETNSKAVLIDQDLNPSVQKKIEKFVGLPILDRTALVLAIFAIRASTKEGKLQVRVAQMQYLLPRLTRMWTHLGRIGGGTAGMRGKGEKQIESDRRTIRKQIQKYKQELKALKSHRERVQTRRRKSPFPIVSMVGYTNAGKSTLLERFSGEVDLSEDALFATLDPKVRRVKRSGLEFLLSDTVGFIDRLSTDIVEAFHATLEIAKEADLILLVLDASDEQVHNHLQVAQDTLKIIGADGVPVIYCLNKIDRGVTYALPVFQDNETVVRVSAFNDASLDKLAEEIGKKFSDQRVFLRLRIPAQEGRVRAQFFKDSFQTVEQWDNDECILSGFVPPECVNKYSQYS